MFRVISQIFNKNNKDLRKRIYFTLACLGLFCLGTTITIPWAKEITDNLGFLEIFNLMSGGGLRSFSIFALGVHWGNLLLSFAIVLSSSLAALALGIMLQSIFESFLPYLFS